MQENRVTQYDNTALDYQKISAAVSLRDAEWYSLRRRLCDLTGLSVLDLACGGTRLLKRWGCARGERRHLGADDCAGPAAVHVQPLGIDYHIAGALRLGNIGSSDRVATAYRLH